MKFLLSLAVWLCAALLVQLVSALNVAVVEYCPIIDASVSTRDEAVRLQMKNIDMYEDFAANAKADGVDVIVFPEYGIYGTYPNLTRAVMELYAEVIPKPPYNPCVSSDSSTMPVTYRLSCIARKLGITLVVNMADIVNSSLLYNTEVAFSSSGEVAAVYHKTHLYYEPMFDTPVSAEPVILEVSGFRLGLLVCYDIMFPYPAMTLLDQHVDAVILSSWWVNTPPLITSLGYWQAWARFMNTTLIVSTIGCSSYQSGSGIFAAGGRVLTDTFNPSWQPENIMRSAEIPKAPVSTAVAKPIGLQDNLPCGSMQTSFVVLHASAGSLSTSVGDVQCSLDYEYDDLQGPHALFALDGNYNGLFCLKACALMQCVHDGSGVCKYQEMGQIQTYGTFKRSKLCVAINAESFHATRFFPIFTSNFTAVYDPSQLSISVEDRVSSVTECLQTDDDLSGGILNLALYGRVWGI
jgi:predicted amidohydrolase